MLGLAEHAHQLVDGERVVNGDDVGARHHDIFDRELAEAQDAPEHAALLRAQRIALAARQRILDQFAQVRLLAETESLEQALEPGHLLIGLTRFFFGKRRPRLWECCSWRYLRGRRRSVLGVRVSDAE